MGGGVSCHLSETQKNTALHVKFVLSSRYLLHLPSMFDTSPTLTWKYSVLRTASHGCWLTVIKINLSTSSIHWQIRILSRTAGSIKSLSRATNTQKEKVHLCSWGHYSFMSGCMSPYHYAQLSVPHADHSNQATYFPEPFQLSRHDIKRGCSDKPRLL